MLQRRLAGIPEKAVLQAYNVDRMNLMLSDSVSKKCMASLQDAVALGCNALGVEPFVVELTSSVKGLAYILHEGADKPSDEPLPLADMPEKASLVGLVPLQRDLMFTFPRGFGSDGLYRVPSAKLTKKKAAMESMFHLSSARNFSDERNKDYPIQDVPWHRTTLKEPDLLEMPFHFGKLLIMWANESFRVASTRTGLERADYSAQHLASLERISADFACIIVLHHYWSLQEGKVRGKELHSMLAEPYSSIADLNMGERYAKTEDGSLYRVPDWERTFKKILKSLDAPAPETRVDTAFASYDSPVVSKENDKRSGRWNKGANRLSTTKLGVIKSKNTLFE